MRSLVRPPGRLLPGPKWHDHGLVCDRGDGEAMNGYVVAWSLDRILTKHPVLPRITMHGTRQTMATLALGGGLNPKVFQERLGHANI